MVADYYRSRI